MSRAIKLAAATIALALTTTIAAIVAYDRSRDASQERTVRYHVSLDPQEPAVAGNVDIQHVRRGCHVWTKGGLQASSLRLSLTRGARLQVLNRDVVPHQLVQLQGPNLGLRGHMMIGKTQPIIFRQPGVYLFRDEVVEMGPKISANTIGPDNTLRLAVSVG